MHLALGVWAIFWLLFWVFVGRPWLQRWREAKALRRDLVMLYPQPQDDGMRNIIFSVVVAVVMAALILPVFIAAAAHGGG